MSAPVIENPFKHPAEVDVSALTAKLIELLTRAIPALSVSVDLAKSADSRAKRRKLLNEVEAAVGDEKVKELVSTNHDVHVLPQCSNDERHASAAEEEREACAQIALDIYVGNTEIPARDANESAAWKACAEFILDEIRGRS